MSQGCSLSSVESDGQQINVHHLQEKRRRECLVGSLRSVIMQFFFFGGGCNIERLGQMAIQGFFYPPADPAARLQCAEAPPKRAGGLLVEQVLPVGTSGFTHLILFCFVGARFQADS